MRKRIRLIVNLQILYAVTHAELKLKMTNNHANQKDDLMTQCLNDPNYTATAPLMCGCGS